jgi:hypothetical protein
MFLGQGLVFQQILKTLQPKMNGIDGVPNATSTVSADLKAQVSRLRGELSNMASEDTSATKNQTAATEFEPPPATTNDLLALRDAALPPDDLMDALVEIYFNLVHPWIPMLHVRQFRERIAVPSERHKVSNIFYAVTSLCARFLDDPRLGGNSQKAQYTKKCRQVVILRSMESFSVENLQALIICAFDLVRSVIYPRR